MEKKCILCKIEEASSHKAHIITKWLFKDIGAGQNTKQYYKILVDENKGIPFYKPSPDINFEKFLLCVSCELYMKFIEDYVKEVFYDKYKIIDIYKNEAFFRTIKIKSDTVTYCEGVNETIFALFVLCQVYRSSMSIRPEFNRLQLFDETKETFRKLLLSFKSNSYHELLNLAEQKNITEFKFLLLMLSPDTKISASERMINIFSRDDHLIHSLEINDMIFWVSDRIDIDLYNKDFATNTGVEKLKVLQVSDSTWTQWHINFFKQIL